MPALLRLKAAARYVTYRFLSALERPYKQSRRQVCPEQTAGPCVEGASRVTSPDSPEDGPPPEAMVGIFENGCRCDSGIPRLLASVGKIILVLRHWLRGCWMAFSRLVAGTAAEYPRRELM